MAERVCQPTGAIPATFANFAVPEVLPDGAPLVPRTSSRRRGVEATQILPADGGRDPGGEHGLSLSPFQRKIVYFPSPALERKTVAAFRVGQSAAVRPPVTRSSLEGLPRSLVAVRDAHRLCYAPTRSVGDDDLSSLEMKRTR